jgi:hypothetical protein
MDLYFEKTQWLRPSGRAATICNCTAASTNAKSSDYGSSYIAKAAEWVRRKSQMCVSEGIFMKFIDFCRPPVISGSHTLQHPNKSNKHHDANAMVIPQHQQYPTNMRQMALGTQTLGRHHHSPNHMRQNSGKSSILIIVQNDTQ